MLEEWIRILWAPAIFVFTIAAALFAITYQARLARQRGVSRTTVEVDPRPAYRVNVDLMRHDSNYPSR